MDTPPLTIAEKRKRSGERVRRLRRTLKLNQTQLASEATTGRKQVYLIEAGQKVDVDVYARVAKVLCVFVDEIIPEEYAAWQFKTLDALGGHQRQQQSMKENPAHGMLDQIRISSLDGDRAAQELAADQVPTAWLKLLRRFDFSFSATNFIPHSEIFKNKHADLARDIQAIQKRLGRTIRKILIAKSRKELKQYEEEMKRQIVEARLPEVRCVIHKKIIENSALNSMLTKLETIDFGLFDGNIVLLWILNPATRHVERGRILVGKEHFTAYENFFNALFIESDEYDPRIGII